MSTIKSSAENLTLNADGSGNDVLIQSNGSTKAIVTAEGTLGIGTTSPDEALDVEGTIQISRTDGYTANWKQTITHASSAYNGTLYVTGSTSTGGVIFRPNGSPTVSFPVAGGITFGTDTAAANALDDYEEGSWTPAWNTGSNGRSISNSGSYTKIGNRVHVSGYFVMGGNSNTGSGDVSFSGLPFTSSSTGNSRAATSSIWFHLATAANISGWVQDNSQLFYFRESGTTGDAADLGNHIDQNTFLFFAATYVV